MACCWCSHLCLWVDFDPGRHPHKRPVTANGTCSLAHNQLLHSHLTLPRTLSLRVRPSLFVRHSHNQHTPVCNTAADSETFLVPRVRQRTRQHPTSFPSAHRRASQLSSAHQRRVHVQPSLRPSQYPRYLQVLRAKTQSQWPTTTTAPRAREIPAYHSPWIVHIRQKSSLIIDDSSAAAI
ncbi:unnamed protein product [Zymoseptoria tritici ST99CH_3D7]|uniref:Uncharacterized protein n=1 Tax=Zymoseptoria tritici (strain ST99CH_3D7) TaxID=1276538 RepID=A0A1X7RWD5_ZYMT9|nr:unnamed protein product [Zymoseptoria tritici ST99CH_3D7]